MKRVFLFVCLLFIFNSQLSIVRADETITVSATSSDISENLDLKTVATLFGQAKDLEQFEQMLNSPDSAFSNLDLNGDGEVDYLRVVEAADNDRHLVVIQAVLAKDIYQDVASIYVEKDENNQVVVQVVGDEYIYGTNYIIEPVYIYRPLIYDWFWGSSWVCWHSPYYWGYYPTWWHPYHCIDPFLYWDHCYWHHYHYPICSYRTVHHHRPHYRPMYDRVSRNDYAQRHPDRSFVTRNASRNVSNARALEQGRRTAMREATAVRSTSPSTRVSTTSTSRGVQTTRNTTYGSSNVRSTTTTTRGSVPGTTTRSSSTLNATRSARTQEATGRTTTTTSRSISTMRSNVSTTTRTKPNRTSVSTTSPSRSSSSAVRSSATSSPSRSSSTMRSSGSSTPRSSGTMSSPGGASRSGGGSSSRGGGGATRR